MDKFTSYSKKQLAANAAALADLQEKLAAEGVSMNTILVPIAAQVLTDKLPAHAPVTDYTAILQVLADAGVDTTDVLSALAAHSSENIYYCTDHHWTSLGAYYVSALVTHTVFIRNLFTGLDTEKDIVCLHIRFIGVMDIVRADKGNVQFLTDPKKPLVDRLLIRDSMIL